MKVSLNWVREYIKVDLTIDELVKKIGAQLGAVEEVTDLGEKYQGIIIAKVVSCEKLPETDKLSVCLVDDGKAAKNVQRDAQGLVQVVCGAPNVKAGMMVAWLSPGTTVPSTLDKEPLTLEAREIRGVVSNGMLASAHELGISDDHSGIVELHPMDAKPGDDFMATYKLDDHIIDIENKMFTHRPDCFGILGVAREIAGITQQQFTSPVWYRDQPHFPTIAESLPLVVKNELPELVPRFMAVPLTIESNGPSPLWLQSYLSRVGLRPINTIVDITNYMMMLTGQPLHAYDYDKVKALSNGEVSLVVRYPKQGEKITLLGGKEVEPRKDAIMIATDKTVIGIGGAMGGADTEVDANTKNIILECANFDMYSIRKTAMEHGVFTDAVTCFIKGQSPLQNDRVIANAVDMVMQLAGGKVAGPVQDDNHVTTKQQPVAVTAEFINVRLGLSLKATEMAALLQNVEFEVAVSGEELSVTAPFWRTDIEIPEDIVEEIGRLYGYDHLPIELPERSIKPTQRDVKYDFKAKVRDILSRAGANEVLTYSFVHGDLLKKVGQDPEQAFQLSNALSPDLQYYRLSLTPSLLDKVHPNIKAGINELAIFEIGKAHNKLDKDEEGLPKEHENLALVVAASDKLNKPGAAYYLAKYYLDLLASELGVELRYEPLTEEAPFAPGKPFDPARSARVYLKDAEKPLGMIGEFKASVRRSLKLPVSTAGFEIGIRSLIEASAGKRYLPLSRFPSVEQDMTLKVPASMLFQDVDQAVAKAIFGLVDTSTMQIGRTPLDIYQKEGDSHKHISYRFTVASMERTLTAQEVNELLDRVAASASAERV